ELNDDIRKDGLKLPGGVFPEHFGLPVGGVFEAYLPHIPSQVARCNCGSGAHGSPAPWDIENAPGVPQVGPVESQAIRRQVAAELAARQRARGDVPAGWQRWAKQVLEPTIDWRQHLAGAVREAVAWASGAVDYTYSRPSRRQRAIPGIVLPSLRRPLPRVAIVIDTSGSMSDVALGAALSEVTGVLRAVGVGTNELEVWACDAAVQSSQRVRQISEITLKGGGGTDMTVGIQRALAVPRPPHVVIVLTDGLTPWPEVPSRTRIIAGLIGKDPPQPPGHIEAVRIPRE
ncbi:MAG TPA: VWA-like domain-containing protein, partial [Polyangiaceae bacterium]|nr:VWA-like domain-containing protein [Polyangiaceae bacterium]